MIKVRCLVIWQGPQSCQLKELLQMRLKAKAGL